MQVRSEWHGTCAVRSKDVRKEGSKIVGLGQLKMKIRYLGQQKVQMRLVHIQVWNNVVGVSLERMTW